MDSFLFVCLFTAFTFTGSPGLKASLSDSAVPYDYFRLFIDDDLAALLVDNTNVYANQCQASTSMKPHSRLKRWKPVNADDVYLFLACATVMGLVVKPEIKDYWSTNAFLDTPIMHSIMSRNRFEIILTHMHFVDNTIMVNKCNKLWKIQPALDHFVKKFSSVYIPEQNIN